MMDEMAQLMCNDIIAEFPVEPYQVIAYPYHASGGAAAPSFLHLPYGKPCRFESKGRIACKQFTESGSQLPGCNKPEPCFQDFPDQQGVIFMAEFNFNDLFIPEPDVKAAGRHEPEPVELAKQHYPVAVMISVNAVNPLQ